MVKVLFVCTGNICRSPTAEGVFRHLVAQAGLSGRIAADSAATHDYHIGAPPDPRTCRAALERGVDLRDLRARQVSADDFLEFDMVLAMDEGHHRLLSRLCPPGFENRLAMFMDFAPHLGVSEVPDPYYGGPDGFETVLDLVEAASRGLLDHIRREFEALTP
ncbi:low molecular weight protein-tyrosine-phosphatase [Telmatospirillum sp. J64-1]|uniref:low molecular weight protein-tyrosine-phosphatase n=1 Tax=Telmatospirillum sp. J64-1 TaxID=2502183 RepID=UPI00115E4799|nr:low molecular weight protein-tyrosine-phosphatase [Telmatospirillum sp. J64-1]